MLTNFPDMPPLVALRAFETTARHLSATRAAEELHVTLGAVSHQLRGLEEFLGFELFVREHRQLTLTPRGAQYFDAITGPFSALRLATQTIMQPSSKELLKVRAYTTFSLYWLIPRLTDFYEHHKNLELVLSVSNDPVDFKRDDINFAIRLGDGEWPGVISERLLPNVVSPVCSPSYLQKNPLRGGVKGLRQHILLQSTRPERKEEWPAWLKAQGIAQFEGYKHMYYESSALSYQAAVEGHGIAMGHLALVQRDLEGGRLIRLFDQALDNGIFTYYLIYPANRRLSERMKEFRAWLIGACT
jgi:LysR family glycine cleavage system transcriptional activator